MEINSISSSLSQSASILGQLRTNAQSSALDSSLVSSQLPNNNDAAIASNASHLKYSSLISNTSSTLDGESKYLSTTKESFRIKSQVSNSINESLSGSLANLLEVAGGVSATYADATPSMSKKEIEDYIKRYALRQQLNKLNEEHKKDIEQEKDKEKKNQTESTEKDNAPSVEAASDGRGVTSSSSTTDTASVETTFDVTTAESVSSASTIDSGASTQNHPTTHQDTSTPQEQKPTGPAIDIIV
ncbi:hypothetical protein DesfrDRAFT_0868 [Solidesulfovibrio fructosivorans JJ]]|uniref:Uncharacterized protein n=1 Tax=Solidesulfovibrio fructosivorans JJ] TaxID=596151 RepID=E1JTB9_SOLFR|nr:hypothetical protein [Solidesulfovibrio fructosivorans]EFL52379.1 hypothetical protein DesfrDRAFT_0868 [Solidesulfovibrio fructosivorans JJ]]